MTDDDKCDALWGNCKDTRRGCRGGPFGVNMCAGPAGRMCCIQDGKNTYIITKVFLQSVILQQKSLE